MPVKTCERCGKAFGCQSESRGCWCEDLTLGAETLRMLREHYNNCLCPECLAMFEEKNRSTSDSIKES